MLKSVRTSRGVIAATGVLGVLAAGVAGGVAIADDAAVKAHAPHAQASALVNADGSRPYSKGIKSLTKPRTGEYCITFDDATGIKVARSTPMATLYGHEGTAPWGWTVYVTTQPSKACGEAANTLTVFTGSNSGAADYPFLLLVP